MNWVGTNDMVAHNFNLYRCVTRHGGPISKKPRDTSEWFRKYSWEQKQILYQFTIQPEEGCVAIARQFKYETINLTEAWKALEERSVKKLLLFFQAIVPNTFVDGPAPRKLYLDLLDRFPSVTVNHVQRRHFSEATGLQMIQQYCSRESESVMVVVKDK